MREKRLSGLSPKENREIPPLDYPRVYQLKRDFPHLTMSINGGIKSLEEAKAHLEHMDGVMVGREAYQNPGILATVDREIFGVDGADSDPVAVVRAMYPYIERELSHGTYLGHITRHMLGLFRGILVRASGVVISARTRIKPVRILRYWNTRCVWLRINVKFR